MEEPRKINEQPHRPDSFWFKVYLSVIVTTFLVVTALWAFSRFFTR